MNKGTKEIICIAEDIGKTHDFNLYKDTIGGRVLASIKAQMDSGYQGIAELHKNSETPKKKPKGGELTKEEKAEKKSELRQNITNEVKQNRGRKM